MYGMLPYIMRWVKGVVETQSEVGIASRSVYTKPIKKASNKL